MALGAAGSLALTTLQNLVVAVNGLNAKAQAYLANPPGSVLLNTLPGAGAPTLSDTTSFTKAFTGGVAFRSFYLDIDHLTLSGADTLALLVHSGGSFRNSGYDSVAGVTNRIVLSGTASAAGAGINGTVRVRSPGLVAISMWDGQVVADNAGTLGILQPFGAWNTAAVIDGFQLFCTGGANIVSGNVYVYGYS